MTNQRRPKILLTGLNGQVGWELNRILPSIADVFPFDRKGMDLAKPRMIRETVRRIKPDIIVNAAAYTIVDQAEEDPDLAMAINGTAPGILAEEARRLDALMVHYSTNYVFDGAKTGPYTEEDKPAPLNVYGNTKLAGEVAIGSTWGKHLIFRTGWVYGSRGKNFPLAILRLLGENGRLRVVDDQFGSPTWCRRVAKATCDVLGAGHDLEEAAGRYGTFNLTSSGQTTWYGFAREILSISLGEEPSSELLMPIKTDQYPFRARRPLNSVLCCDKIQAVFGVGMPCWDIDPASVMDTIDAY